MRSKTTANRNIVILLILAILMPGIGFMLGAYLEIEYWADDWAAAVWAITVFSSALYLTYANRIAAKTFEFRALAPFAFVAWIASAVSVGWVANNAWYNYDSFSGYVEPDYLITQSKIYPNHFLFTGPMEIGAATDLTEYVLGAEGVDWNEPVVLEINSEGGSPQVGILIGEFIKLYDIHIEVVGQCISACTFALMSSDSRYVHPRAWVGFHAAYVELEEGERYTDADLKFYDSWRDKGLMRLGATPEFIEQAGVQDASGGYFPTYAEIVKNGIANTFNRAYLSADEMPGYL